MDALSAAVPMKIDLDIQPTLIASGLYRVLAKRLGNGFENARAPPCSGTSSAQARAFASPKTKSSSASGEGHTTPACSPQTTPGIPSQYPGSEIVACNCDSTDRGIHPLTFGWETRLSADRDRPGNRPPLAQTGAACDRPAPAATHRRSTTGDHTPVRLKPARKHARRRQTAKFRKDTLRSLLKRSQHLFSYLFTRSCRSFPFLRQRRAPNLRVSPSHWRFVAPLPVQETRCMNPLLYRWMDGGTPVDNLKRGREDAPRNPRPRAEAKRRRPPLRKRPEGITPEWPSA